MNALTITTDASGKVTEVKIDDKVIDNVTEVSQSLVRGELVATIKASFSSISTIEREKDDAAALTVTFSAGSALNSTKAMITGSAGSGNHFAYAIAASTQSTPKVGDVISGATMYTSGRDITGVAAGKSVAIYELTSDNKAVKFAAHTLTSGEIKTE